MKFVLTESTRIASITNVSHALMLACLAELSDIFRSSPVVARLEREGEVWLFRSGAKLAVYEGKFGIYGYSPGGSDVLLAIEELKMANHLRLARKHHLALRKQMILPGNTVPVLRVSREYVPADSSLGQKW